VIIYAVNLQSSRAPRVSRRRLEESCCCRSVEDFKSFVEEFEVASRRRRSLHLLVLALEWRRVDWRHGRWRQPGGGGWGRDDPASTVLTDVQRLQSVRHHTQYTSTSTTAVQVQLSVKAKFHYASWFEAGRRQVRSWTPTSFEPSPNQVRTS